jgi:hypothetical protein
VWGPHSSTCPHVEVLVQVADESRNDLRPGAVDYETVVAQTGPEVDATPTADDLYILYTGGTTGSVSTGTFSPGPGTVVVSEDLDKVVEPGHDGLGWLAQQGWVPLGYYGDADETARTFPEIGGVRYSVPGDRARHLANGDIELLGRDSVTINSGGEKIFAEEVEGAIAGHPAVHDVVVVGRPSELGAGGRGAGRAVGRGDGHPRRDRAPRQRAHRPLQAAQARAVPRHDPAQPLGQGRLSLGEVAGAVAQAPNGTRDRAGLLRRAAIRGIARLRLRRRGVRRWSTYHWLSLQIVTPRTDRRGRADLWRSPSGGAVAAPPGV